MTPPLRLAIEIRGGDVVFHPALLSGLTTPSFTLTAQAFPTWAVIKVLANNTITQIVTIIIIIISPIFVFV